MVTKFTKWEEQKAVICHAVSMQLIHRFIFKLYMLKNEWTFYSRLPTKTEAVKKSIPLIDNSMYTGIPHYNKL